MGPFPRGEPGRYRADGRAFAVFDPAWRTPDARHILQQACSTARCRPSSRCGGRSRPQGGAVPAAGPLRLPACLRPLWPCARDRPIAVARRGRRSVKGEIVLYESQGEPVAERRTPGSSAWLKSPVEADSRVFSFNSCTRAPDGDAPLIEVHAFSLRQARRGINETALIFGPICLGVHARWTP